MDKFEPKIERWWLLVDIATDLYTQTCLHGQDNVFYQLDTGRRNVSISQACDELLILMSQALTEEP